MEMLAVLAKTLAQNRPLLDPRNFTRCDEELLHHLTAVWEDLDTVDRRGFLGPT